jgi:hypothetical protein
MKAQRVYTPTPLASLQKMSFSILSPENQVLSKMPDAVPIINVHFGNAGMFHASNYYADSNANYIFLETSIWFPLWSFSPMDRVQFAGLTASGQADLLSWLQSTSGHVIIGTAFLDGSKISLGQNNVGYSNYIIIQNRLVNPDSGFVTREFFNSEITTVIFSGAALNTSHQVQLTMRVTVRELDSATNLRPDNI